MDKDVPADGYMDLSRVLDYLVAMSQPVPQDQRLDHYCHCVNLALSEYGQEHCMVVGSTKEETRLRTPNDEGDWDILVVGDITVPVESLMYRKDLPCFVHIHGSFLKGLERKDLIDGTFLPTTLVKKLSPLLFRHVKSIFDFCCRPESFKIDGVPRVSMATDIKPGINVTSYTHWQSDFLNLTASPRPAGNKALIEKCIKRLKQSKVFQNESNGIAHFVQIVARICNTCKTQTFLDSPFYHWFGHCFAGIDVDQMVSSENNQKENESIHSASDGISNARGMEYKDHTRVGTTKPQGVTTSERTRTLTTDQYESLPFIQIPSSSKAIRATYGKKSMKDFIPALRLSGPPIYIDQWTKRNRYWPNTNAVGAISRGQFFVVAKQAVKDERPEIDFCLSCNLAEIMLAKEMPPGHRKCLLMIKAFQRSILEGYANALTTFHWKTALYWMLESTDPATYSESSDDVLDVLKSLLYYMRDRLHEGYLQHYFFPSNLFAGLETCVRAEIVRKIEEICLSPAWYLNAFLVQKARKKEANLVDVSLGKMMAMKKNAEKDKDDFYADTLLDLLEGFGQPNSSSEEISDAEGRFPNLVLRITEAILTKEQPVKGKENDISQVEPTKCTSEAGQTYGSSEAEQKNCTSQVEQKKTTSETGQRNGTRETEQRNGTRETEQRNGTRETEQRNGTNDVEQKNGTSEAGQNVPLKEIIRSSLADVLSRRKTNSASINQAEENLIENIMSFLSSKD